MGEKRGRPRYIDNNIVERRQKVLELNHSNKSYLDISKILGVSPGVIKWDLDCLKEDPKNNIKAMQDRSSPEEVSKRRKKVLELNHQFKSLGKIAKILGVSYDLVAFDLGYLRRTGNVIKGRREVIDQRIREKAAAPEPDKKIECPNCGGSGGVQLDEDRAEECLECAGTGLKDSFYGNIVKENVDLLTIQSRLKAAKKFMHYIP